MYNYVKGKNFQFSYKVSINKKLTNCSDMKVSKHIFHRKYLYLIHKTFFWLLFYTLELYQIHYVACQR
jgi:hypothetical protein